MKTEDIEHLFLYKVVLGNNVNNYYVLATDYKAAGDHCYELEKKYYEDSTDTPPEVHSVDLIRGWVEIAE